jgi:1,4-dihydroxy-2-naphthoate polyprenyltransferase
MNDEKSTLNLVTPDSDPGHQPSTITVCLTAGRAWALPASTMSVAFGTVLAVTIGGAAFDLGLFLLAFVSMALLQVGANMLNDVYDYRNGLDTQVNPASGAVVRGWISPRRALAGAALCILIGSALGFYIVSRVGLSILGLGAVGVLCGILYTWGPWPLKYHALGDLAVFLNFGVLGALGAWTVQTGHLSWVPAVWAVPMSLLVIAILHSNNWRDIASDTGGKIRTVASCLGDARSHTYQRALLFGPFLIIAGLVLLTHVTALSPPMPWTFLITLLALPLALRLVRTGAGRHEPQKSQAFAALDGATAQLNLLFGLLCIAALGLHALMK